ncbi:MAG: hypothetical protein ACREC5_07900, partial [Thermoplasmata archaeon]
MPLRERLPERALEIAPSAAPEAVDRLLVHLAARLAAACEGRALLEVPWARAGSLRLLGFDVEGWEGFRTGHPEVPVLPASPGPPWEPPVDDAHRSTAVLLVGSAVEVAAPRPNPLPVPRAMLRDRGGSEGAPDPPATIPLPAGAWATLQVHWSSSGQGELWVAGRIVLSAPDLPALLTSISGPLFRRLQERGLVPSSSLARWGRRERAEWRSGAWKRLRPMLRFRLAPVEAARFALVGGLSAAPDPEESR